MQIFNNKFVNYLYLQYKYNNKYFRKYMNTLRKYEYANRKELDDYTLYQIKKLLVYAYENVEFYKDRFDECEFNPYTFNEIQEIEKIPILTKKEIIDNKEKMISKQFRNKKLNKITTGGTTGTPMEFYFSEQSKYIRQGNWAKWKLSSKVDYKYDKYCYIGRILGSNSAWEYNGNILQIASNQLSVQNVKKIIKEMERFQPKYIQGYASAVYILATIIERENIDISKIMIKSILTSSDTMFKDYREKIEKIFQCKVYDHYGQNEDCVAATECDEHNGYHIHEESTYIEVVDIYSNNKISSGIGKIIGTNLFNYAMPLIRYEIGDVGEITLEKCKCGNEHKRIINFQGRIDDIIKLKDGRRIAAGSLNQPMKYSNNEIIECQYIQESMDELVINVVPDINFSDKTLKTFQEELETLIGNTLNIKFNVVENIPRAKNGKYKFIISKVK